MGNFAETVRSLSRQTTDSTSEETSLDKDEISPGEIFVNVSDEEAANICMWKPKEADIDASIMHEFQGLIEKKYQLKFGKNILI